jgi:hypothetical protein
VCSEAYIIAFDVRHAQGIGNMFRNGALSTSCRPGNKPYVVMFRLVAVVCGHGVVRLDHVRLYGVPHRLRG